VSGPALAFVCHVEVELGAPLELGVVDGVRHRTIPIVGGRFTGERMTGEVLDGGADWQTVDSAGTAAIDTRYTLRTSAGSLVGIATRGFRHGPPAVLARLAAGEPVAAEEYYFRLTAQLTTADESLRWLTRTVFVATAAREAARVLYDLYEVL
jgi:hypothetical protein